ncbi:MAG: hypothetical protein LAO56_08985 [Acidobacteriia bacterium]|nr:hypothetical protein [Terriglobia bacterium]
MTLNSKYVETCLSPKGPRTVLTAVLVLFFGTLAAMAAPIVVDANATPCIATTAHYTTIQAAVNAAPSGATVQVCPGVYPEQVSIGTSLTLKGVTKNNQAGAVIAIPANGGVQNGGTSTFPIVAQVDITAQNVTLNNMTIDGTGGIPNSNCSVPILVGVAFEAGSSGHVTHSALLNQAVGNGPGGSNGHCGYAIQVFPAAGGLVTIDTSSIRGFGGDGVAADSPVTVKGNFIDQGLTSANLLQQGTGIFTSEASTITGNTVQHVAFGIAGGINSTGVTTISGNNISADGFGVDIYFGSGISVLKNTISGGLQNPGLTGGNVGVDVSTSGVTVQSNQIAGFYYGVLAGGGNTVSLNTITDAQVGVWPAAGNTVSGNHFYDVTTLLMN